MIEILEVKNTANLLEADIKAVLLIIEKLKESCFSEFYIIKMSYETMEQKNGIYRWFFKIEGHDYGSDEYYYLKIWVEEYKKRDGWHIYPVRITECKIYLLQQDRNDGDEHKWKETSLVIK